MHFDASFIPCIVTCQSKAFSSNLPD